MTRELWAALHGYEVNEAELVTLISHYFKRGQWEPGTDAVELRHVDGGPPALTLRFQEGFLIDIESGPALGDQDVETLRDRIENAALPTQEERVSRDVFFSLPEVTGYWRYRDGFQVLPAPPDAPRPGFVMGLHPFIVEISLLRWGRRWP